MQATWMLAAAGVAAGACLAAEGEGAAKIVEVRRIWDRAPHNAFTDLVRFDGRWVCTFREGTGHVSHDGKVRVIASKDGAEWAPLALLTTPSADVPDLRDPKLTVTPDGRLMLTAAGANRTPGAAAMRTYAWSSSDGKDWAEPVRIGDDGFWLWRVTWHKGAAYTVGYNRKIVCLYRSADGRTFQTLVDRLFEEGYPNEASLAFGPDDTCLCLLRRDGKPNTAMLGTARPPYAKWTWRDLGARLGGPKLLRLPDGRWLAGGRRYDGGVRMSLMWLDPAAGKLSEFLRLPSGGDTSYPGLGMHDGLLWVSYYSSHEKKTGIYLAKAALPRKPG
ncbi:MAG TPA: sialidase family protein [Phycisphaerae bacterium]|nr:sialidase family protein [Phycisphaerae bacterium]